MVILVKCEQENLRTLDDYMNGNLCLHDMLQSDPVLNYVSHWSDEKFIKGKLYGQIIMNDDYLRKWNEAIVWRAPEHYPIICLEMLVETEENPSSR